MITTKFHYVNDLLVKKNRYDKFKFDSNMAYFYKTDAKHAFAWILYLYKLGLPLISPKRRDIILNLNWVMKSEPTFPPIILSTSKR